MEKFTVKITESALADMDEIYNYIATTLCAPATAAKKYNRIADEILTLSEWPYRYGIPSIRICEELKLHRMLVDNFSVFYLIRDPDVIVTDVLYSASDLSNRLNDRY